ncbi:MAG: hypothetical protein RLZZ428_634 [Pseudomonadota bacterium]|jgi:N-formylglutamate amidohydrolase
MHLIHLPHCGVQIPDKYISDYLLSPEELEANVYQYADLYTDELYASLFDAFGGVKSDYSRLFFDPERFFDDSEEHMQKQFGLGWFYENAILEKKSLRTTKHKKEIASFYDAHHEKLNALTQEKLDQYGRCTVIDCHSFSNERYWFHDKEIELPDICIGYEPYHTDGELIGKVIEIFSEYKIAINAPYAGSLVPTNYWRKDERVKSVMIEINKKLYLNEDGRTKSNHFETMQKKLNDLATALKDQS